VSRILIKNGQLIDPANHINQLADISIVDGKIESVSKANTQKAAQIDETNTHVINASGLIVSPGLVDCCARLREPGQEHKADIDSETIAASYAGITTLCCPPDTDPVIDEPAVIELIHQKAALSGHSKVVTLGALTAGLNGEHLSEMRALQEAGCVGVSNAQKPVANTLVLKRAFAYAATFDLCVFIQPNDYWLSLNGCAHEGIIASRLGLKGIPTSAETVAIASALQLIKETGVQAHFGRLSTADAVTMIGRAKHDQLPITADVSAHQLHLTELDISNFNSSCHVQPPLRTQRDQEALKQGIANGIIDAICSDHQPHEQDAKQAPFASTQAGISGLETFLPLALRLNHSGIPMETIIRAITQAPADILGLNSGRLSVGAEADICIFDENEDWQLNSTAIHSKGLNTPFYGWNLQAKVKHTIVAGKLIEKRQKI